MTTELANANPTYSIFICSVGQELAKDKAEQGLVNQKGAIRYREAYLLNYAQGEAWFFDYGIVVCWNMTTEDRKQLTFELRELVKGNADDYYSEQYRYLINPDAEFKVQHDLIVLREDSAMHRLALSHAFAQSTKLQFFEDKAQQVIQDNRSISKELARTGKIPLSRIKIAKLRGLLFDTSSDISLHFNLLDTPEFFWDYPNLEIYYQTLVNYLDLKARLGILQHKLATIHELLDMLATEQHHKHSSILEWIIIILIAVDILIYFLPKSA